VLDVKDFGFFSLSGVRRSCVSRRNQYGSFFKKRKKERKTHKGDYLREFERWSPPKFKIHLSLSTFVNINNALATLADLDAGHFVDCLGYVLTGLTTATGPITHGIDGKLAGSFSNTPESSRWRDSSFLDAFKRTEYFKGRVSR
jgi:hypothetical protein